MLRAHIEARGTCFVPKERSPVHSGHTFFNEIALDFPKLQRRKKEAV